MVEVATIPIPRKSLGQHWLEDELTLENICSLADIKSNDTVLEIGPGYGNLTKLLTAQADHVIAVELDNRLANNLNDHVKAENLRVINDSILNFDLTTLPENYKLVANIPYYLTSNLLRLLSETGNPPILIVLLVQKEVAERVAASPGSMSLLSVTTQFFWDVGLDAVVPAKMFTPPPKVDSQILLLIRRTKLLFPGIDRKAFFRLVKVSFSARRKTLLNSLSNGLRIDKDIARELLEQANIDPNTRPQVLSLNDWYKVYKSAEAKKLI